jgi:CelD/BcsL family acetyltransferase involved in cellulose biosynthesis
MNVDVVSTSEAFCQLEPAWNRLLVESPEPSPFLTHEWTRTWWECFGGGARLHVLVVQADGAPVAIAPLITRWRRVFGMPMRCVELMANDHSPRGDFILAGERREVLRAVWRHLHGSRARWDVVVLRQLPQDSDTARELSGCAEADGCRTAVWPSTSSPYLECGTSWDAYSRTLKAKHRAGLRSRLAHLERIGPVALDVVERGHGVPAALSDGFRLEAAAWKAREGTAITSRPDTLKFYRTFADRAASRGWLRLHFLTVGGRRIAFSYSVCFGDALFLLKPGYDPAYGRFAPGSLHTRFVIRDIIDRGLRTLELLGDDDPWKRLWTRTSRPHCWLFVFADRFRPRLAHAAKFRWAPYLRSLGAYGPRVARSR